MYIYSPALNYPNQWRLIQFPDIVQNYSLKTPVTDCIVKSYCNLLDNSTECCKTSNLHLRLSLEICIHKYNTKVFYAQI